MLSDTLVITQGICSIISYLTVCKYQNTMKNFIIIRENKIE